MAKVYVVGNDVSGKGPLSFLWDYEPKLSHSMHNRISKTVTPEHMKEVSRRIIIDDQERPELFEVKAIFGMSLGPYMVNDRVRTILEELEPGRHTFLEMEIVHQIKDGTRIDCGIYHMLVNVPCIDPVIAKESLFYHEALDQRRIGSPQADGGGSLHIGIDDEDPLVFDAAKIGDHHLWRLVHDKYGDTYNKYFCSETLCNRLKAADLEGWGIKRTCTLKPGVVSAAVA